MNCVGGAGTVVSGDVSQVSRIRYLAGRGGKVGEEGLRVVTRAAGRGKVSELATGAVGKAMTKQANSGRIRLCWDAFAGQT